MDYLQGPGPLGDHRPQAYGDESHYNAPLGPTQKIARGILSGAGQRSIQAPPPSLLGRVSTYPIDSPPSRLTGLTKSGVLGPVKKEEAHDLLSLIDHIEDPTSLPSKSPNFRSSSDDALFDLIKEFEKAASPPNPANSKQEKEIERKMVKERDMVKDDKIDKNPDFKKRNT